MQNRASSRLLIISCSLVAMLFVASANAQSLAGASTNGWGKGGKPKPTPKPVDGRSDWNGTTDSDFNTGANWTPSGGTPGSAPPVAGDVAWFASAPTNKSVNLSGSVSIAGVYFNETGSNGYSLTASSPFTLTLTGYATTIGAETGDANAVAIGALNTSGGNTISAPIILAPGSGTTSTISQATGGTLTLSGDISGAGIKLDKKGNGMLVLSGTNSYTGGTTFSAGTLSVESAGALGSTGTLTFVGGRLQYSASNTTDYSSRFSTAAGQNFTFDTNGQTVTLASPLVSSGGFLLKYFGLGELILTGANTYDGQTTILQGTLTVNPGGTLGAATTPLVISAGSGITTVVNINTDVTIGSLSQLFIGGSATLNIASGKTLTDNQSGGNTTFDFPLAGAGNFTKSGTSKLTFSGTTANTLTGLITVAGGELDLSKTPGANSIAGNVTIGDGSGTDILKLLTSNQIANTSDVTINSSGQFDLTNQSETIDALNGSSGATILLGSGTLTVGANNEVAANYAGNIQGSGDFFKTGTGTQILSGTNTYSGITTIRAGTLSVSNIGNAGASSNLGTNATINIGESSSGTLKYTGTGETSDKVISLFSIFGHGATIDQSGTGLLKFTSNLTSTSIANHTLTLQGSTVGAGEISGVISDPGGPAKISVIKGGTGTWTLSGTNTYTGATTVNGGTLLVNGSLAAGSAVGVNNSGTVLGGTGTINGPVTVNADAKLQGGNGTTGTTLTLNAALTLSDNSIIQLALGPGGTHSTLARTGSGTWTFDSNQAFTFIDLGATATTYQNIITGLAADPGTESGWTITNAGYAGTFTFDGANIDLTLTAVPEPSTWIAAALAFGFVGYTLRRRIAPVLSQT